MTQVEPPVVSFEGWLITVVTILAGVITTLVLYIRKRQTLTEQLMKEHTSQVIQITTEHRKDVEELLREQNEKYITTIERNNRFLDELSEGTQTLSENTKENTRFLSDVRDKLNQLLGRGT